MNTCKFKFQLILFFVLLSGTSVFSQNIPDTELKKNISSLTNSLGYITRLEPKIFEYDKEKFNKLILPSGKQFGFNADEFEQVLPEIISTDHKWYNRGKNDYSTTTIKDIEIESLIPILVGAIKEQQSQIQDLQKEIEALKK